MNVYVYVHVLQTGCQVCRGGKYMGDSESSKGEKGERGVVVQ